MPDPREIRKIGTAPIPRHVTAKVVRAEPVTTRLVSLQVQFDVITSPPDWFERLAFFIPKSLSEPWVGDLREKRHTMALQGRSRRAIEWVTLIELLLLFLSWAKDFLLEIFEALLIRS